mmetsp:Transcript_27622/g.35698  ORF Transcript_27622/g.35698 Transcript_27622/m.35698 type:complete len:334 (+) Transcript_27622:37-1038(+)
MGCCKSRLKKSGSRSSVVDELHLSLVQEAKKNKIAKCTAAESIQHYIPPTFPLHPMVTKHHLKAINKTWKLIREGTAEGLTKGTGGKSGIVFFFDDFYFRLYQRSTEFSDFFGGDLRKRGEVLLRITQYIASMDISDRRQLDKDLELLGKTHAHVKRNIRPWMYSVFVETLIESLMYCLGENGTYESSLSWTFALAYILEKMLQKALKGRLMDFEFNANCHRQYEKADQSYKRSLSLSKTRSPSATRRSSKSGSESLSVTNPNRKAVSFNLEHQSLTNQSFSESKQKYNATKLALLSDANKTSQTLPAVTPPKKKVKEEQKCGEYKHQYQAIV